MSPSLSQRHWIILFVCFLELTTVTVVHALDKTRLWLPNKYQDLMPKLINAATQAESTRRCEWVINGTLNVKKSTPEHHYFVITCRDAHRHSYILTYLYPVAGGEAILLTEQGGMPGRQKRADGEHTSIEQPKMDAKMALDICNEAFSVETDTMDGVVVIESDMSITEHADGSFFYQYPFNIDSALGNNIRHRADCRVSNEGEAQIDVFLEPEGALTLCRDALREETLLMRGVNVNDESIKRQKSEDGGYAFTIEFNAKSRRGSPIHYTAQCTVAANGDNELQILLDKSGALAICKDTLRSEAIQLKGLEVIEEQIPAVEESAEGFFYRLPFKATMPDGDKGLYQATCQVDLDGTSDVSFSIDRQSVLPLCIDKLRDNTRTMIDVEVLDTADIPINSYNEGYVSKILFDSKNPMGKTLRYEADCRVSGIGVASVSIAARGKP